MITSLELAKLVTVRCRASNTGVIMVVSQKIALGRIHAGQIVTVHVADDAMTIDLVTPSQLWPRPRC